MSRGGLNVRPSVVIRDNSTKCHSTINFLVSYLLYFQCDVYLSAVTVAINITQT